MVYSHQGCVAKTADINMNLCQVKGLSIEPDLPAATSCQCTAITATCGAHFVQQKSLQQ